MTSVLIRLKTMKLTPVTVLSVSIKCTALLLDSTVDSYCQCSSNASAGIAIAEMSVHLSVLSHSGKNEQS